MTCKDSAILRVICKIIAIEARFAFFNVRDTLFGYLLMYRSAITAVF